MPEHALKKNSGVSHPAVGPFSGYFVSPGADEIRAIASIEPATPVQSMEIGMALSLDEIVQIHQHSTSPIRPVLRRADPEVTLRNRVVAILRT